tara:strand:+ start:408 stop:710 length:303 start_codon:yes stop_codon:yes gene_type:complete
MLFYIFMACHQPLETTGQTVEIPKEAYEWTCRDRQEHSEIEITAGVCNEFETLEVSVSLINEGDFQEEMYHEGGCWWSAFIIQEENCIEIENIIITAKAL